MKRHLLPYTVSCCIMLILSVEIVLPQNFFYNFQTWDARNGLSSNFCNAICSDSNGYIYTGTNNGIYSFNGRRFNILSYPEREPVIGEGNVEDIITDSYNRLWFASKEFGLGLISPNNLKPGVQYFKPDTDSLDYGADRGERIRISNLCFDTTGNLWVGTRGKGLYRFDTLSRTFYHVPLDNPWSPYSQYVRMLSLYTPDSLLIGTINGLSILKPSTGQLSHIRMQYNGKKMRPTIRRAVPWNGDTLLIATDRGTWLLHLLTGDIAEINAGSRNDIDFKKINSNDIIRLTNDELWIATESEGVLFYNFRNCNTIYHSWQLNKSNRGISKGFISRFYTDAGGNLWIAHQNGISLFQTVHNRFNSYSFREEDVYAGHMLAEEEKLLFVKSHSLTVLDPETGNAISHKLPTLRRKNVIPDYVMTENGHYLVFFNDSFFSVNRGTYASRPLLLQKQKVDPKIFDHFIVMKCLADTIDSKKQYFLWAFSSIGPVLLTYDPVSGELDYFSSGDLFKDPFKYKYTNIIKTAPGKYWMSTRNNGVLYIDLNDPEKNLVYSRDAPAPRQIPDDSINDMVIDEKGDLWMLLFEKGLLHLTPNSKDSSRYTLYGREQGLTDSRVYRLVKDNNDNLWITSNLGIFCFDRREEYFLTYNAVNGLNNIRFHINDIALATTTNGYIGIKDEYGELLWFKPGYLQPRRASLVMPRVLANDGQIAFVPSAINVFPPGQNSILFDYDIIDYDKAIAYRVVYKLDGYDKDWQVTDPDVPLSYRKLPGNDYTFRIKLQFADGSYSDEQAISFIVKTIWYKTWWFRIAAMLLLAASLYWLVRDLMNRKLAKQKAAMELEQALKLERARISAELHDDIGGGLSTIRILSETNKYFSPAGLNIESLDKISTHSKELLQKMTEIVWSLNIKNDSLEQLITYIRYHTVKQFDEVNLLNRFEIPEDIPSITVEGIKRRHIQLLVKESINNIIRHADASFVKASISISDRLVFTIHDNGKGIHFNSSTRGNGLGNIKSLAEAVHGMVVFENNNGTMMRFSVLLKNLR